MTATSSPTRSSRAPPATAPPVTSPSSRSCTAPTSPSGRPVVTEDAQLVATVGNSLLAAAAVALQFLLLRLRLGLSTRSSLLGCRAPGGRLRVLAVRRRGRGLPDGPGHRVAGGVRRPLPAGDDTVADRRHRRAGGRGGVGLHRQRPAGVRRHPGVPARRQAAEDTSLLYGSGAAPGPGADRGHPLPGGRASRGSRYPRRMEPPRARPSGPSPSSRPASAPGRRCSPAGSSSPTRGSPRS